MYISATLFYYHKEFDLPYQTLFDRMQNQKTSWKIPGDRSRSQRYPSHAPYLFTVGQKFCRFCMFLIVSWTPSTFTISHTSVAYGIGRYSMVKLDIAVHLTVVLIESSSWLTSSLRMGNWQSVDYRRASWRCIWRQSEIIGHRYHQYCFQNENKVIWCEPKNCNGLSNDRT